MTSITRRDVLLEALAGTATAGLIPIAASAYQAGVPNKLRRLQRRRRRRVLGRRHGRRQADQGRVPLDGKEWETNWIIEHRRVKEQRS